MGTMNAVEYLLGKFISVGTDGKICYSATGAGVRAYETFKPVSELYRATAIARLGGTMLYLGMLELEGGEWVYHPRRIRNPTPGTVDDFTSYGAYYSDLPGDGALIAAASVEGGIVVGEQNQISLIRDGGSAETPWAYQDNYGDGLQLISNLATFGGAAYGICTDGLIYRADYNSVSRLQSFFDLTKFDDFNPGTSRATITFDPATQKLIVFRPDSPYTIYLCEDQTGSVTEFELPEVTLNEGTFVPQAVFVAKGEIGGVVVSYALDNNDSNADSMYLEFQMDRGITGLDVLSYETPWHSEVVTGCFRLTQLGIRGELKKLVFRTNVDPDATVRPWLAVGVKSEPEDDWVYSPTPAGTVTVDGPNQFITGVGTNWTSLVGLGDDVTTDFDVQYLVEKITKAMIYDELAVTWTTTTFTKAAARKIRLPSPLAAGEYLHVWGQGAPARREPKNDILELSDGRMIVMDEPLEEGVTTALFPYIPDDYDDTATHIPTYEFPAGDENGDGKIVVGIETGFDQIMLRFIMLSANGDFKYAKIKKIEFGFEPTGAELKTDDG
jgi:hypothetical protein